MYRTAYLKNSLIIWALTIFLISCTQPQEKLPYYNTPDFTPVFINNSGKALKEIAHTIGNFSFASQDGNIVSEKDIEGKVHIASFIFTSCGSICPEMIRNLKKAGEYFEKERNVVLLSYSVTPWIDDVPKLKAYKQHNGITNPNWYFLTGSQAAIYKLARTSYFAEEDLGFTKDSTEFLHTEHILLVDKTRRIRGIYNGTLKLDIENLITDVQLLLKE